ncbi:hypothetical protein Slin15195_G121200 [Septoria linicola]|uniref:Uncharacterized protein n=1 Tax=Septoria linicola TaxID=215465 RepID=A0A9Q9EPI3_9PEZI|nr:hypothetical protein Slin15195_G121200 [Septoria linicola]
MTLIKRICGFFCAKPTRTDTPEISLHTTTCSHAPVACSLSADALQQGSSARSQPPRELSQTPDSTSYPSPTARSAALRKINKKKWRLSNRNVLFDADGRELFVREFVLQSPTFPPKMDLSPKPELPIYEAQMRYSTLPTQQNYEPRTAEGAGRREDPATHVNAGHDALDLLAKMSASESDIRGRAQKIMRPRPVSMCIYGGKQESVIKCHRAASLSYSAHPHEHVQSATSAISSTEAHNNGGSSAHSNVTDSLIQNSPLHQGPFELEGSQVPVVVHSTPSTPLLLRAQQPLQEDVGATAVTTPDEQTTMSYIPATLPVDRVTNTEPSTPSSRATFGINSLPSTPTTDPSPPSSSFGVSTETGSSERRHSWEDLPPNVYERLYEDALKRQRQQNQEQTPTSTFSRR